MPTYYIEVITPLATFRSEHKEAANGHEAVFKIAETFDDRKCICFTGADGVLVFIMDGVMDNSVVVAREVTP
jgi:acetylglutamate kinase